ncbi:MAG: type II secretion system F family protein, partial [Deltaproteobacteria bacterium]|nr:type II secretion system F family protein [Deltaproteobacteria bacterium]
MPIYAYKGIDAAGKKVNGNIDGENIKAARAKLRKMNIFPTDLTEAGQGGVASISGGINFSRLFQRVKVQEVANMTRQLSTLISANIPLVDAIAALVDQVENPLLKETLSKIKEKVTEGSRLADAMKAYPNIFSDLFTNMIAAGEASGALDTVLVRLADITESQAKLQSKIKGALTYPVVMAFVGVTLMGFLMVSVVPKITKIFEDTKATLPLPTRVLVAVSHFMQNYWYIPVLMIPFIIYAFNRYKKTPKGRLFLDNLSLKMPIFGEMLRMVAISRFCRTMSTMLASGVQLLTAMDIVKNIVDNSVLTQVIEETKNSVKEGESIAEPLKRSGQFPPIVTQMISVGEKTGQLETMLERVADNYDLQVDTKVSTLTT